MNAQSNHPGDVEALKRIVVQVSTIVERLEARSAQAMQQIGQGVNVLDAATRRLNDSGAHMAEAIVGGVRAEARDALSQGSTHAIGEFQRQLQTCAESAKWAAGALSEQRRLLTAAQGALVWKGLIALGLGSLLTTVGCGSMSGTACARSGRPSSRGISCAPRRRAYWRRAERARYVSRWAPSPSVPAGTVST
jgi:hypothetical protein